MEYEQEYCANCDAPVFPPETFLDDDGTCNLCQAAKLHYDYTRQCWIENGKVVGCAHPVSMGCKCPKAGEMHACSKACH